MEKIYLIEFQLVPSALILGGPDLHFDRGSTINLTCTINFAENPPSHIVWYHLDEVDIFILFALHINLTFCTYTQPISYDSSRGGVSLITEKGDTTYSYLLIQNAELSDSGRYSCSPSNADVASVRVFVLTGNT